MSHQLNTINLEGPLDFLIFSCSNVYIRLSEKDPVSVMGQIIDRDNGRILVKISSDLKQLPERVYVSSPYKSRQLYFSAEVIGFDQQNSVYTLQHPSVGSIQNKRQDLRKPFTDELVFHAEINIDSPTHRIRFTTSRLVDFSPTTISLLLDRSQGLALPGDIVTKVAIFSSEQRIFESEGSVNRIEMKYHLCKHDDEYLIVIKLGNKTVVDFSNNRRRSDRTILVNEKSAFVQFYHPFLDQTLLTCPIADLSNSGLSIVLANDIQPMPKGLVVDEGSVQLPLKQRLTISFEVTSVQDITVEEEYGDGYIQRIGLQLLNVNSAVLKELTNFVQQVNSEYLIDANDEDYYRLWELYFETCFIYGNKRRQIQNFANKAFKTDRILLKSNTPLLKKILYKQDGEIKGHVTAIKIFDHTLIIQHLNARKANGGSAAQSVIRGMTTYFLDYSANQRISNRYVCAYYRPNNLYPSLVFGETADIINDTSMCWTRTYDFCLPSNKAAKKTGEVICQEASQADLKNLETLLIDNNEHALMRVEGLYRESLVEMNISKEFEKIGLYRYRKVFVARDNASGSSGYAVCTFTSPGVNFSELTNSVKFYYSDVINVRASQSLADALGEVILDAYSRTDMPNCVLLLDRGQPVPVQFAIEKSYTWWVLDLKYVSKFRDATEHIFGNLKQYIRTRKSV